MTGVEKRGSATTVRACDLCRKRNKRCIWQPEAHGCTLCTDLNEICTTTYVRKQRTKSQRGDSIAEYESRVRKLESLLEERSAAQPRLEQQPLEPARDHVPAADWITKLHTELESLPYPKVPDFETLLLQGFTDTFPSGQNENFAAGANATLLEETPELHTSGNSSDGSIESSVSPLENTAHVQNIGVDSDVFLSPINSIPPPLPVSPECDGYLPPPALATALLSEFLVGFNAAHPLYRPQVLAEHLRVCYSGQSGDTTDASWTTAYVVFGMAYMYRAMSTTATQKDMDFARYYRCRVQLSLNRLLQMPPSLELAQCLIGAAKLMRSTACDLADGYLLATALRVVQSLAYHEDEVELPDSNRDIHQERRVCWLSFICDTYTAIGSNLPTTRRREDIREPDSLRNPSGSAGTMVPGLGRIDFFSLRLKLALLKADAVEQVLSAKASNRYAGAPYLNAAAADVLARLRQFHKHELFGLCPEQIYQLFPSSDIVHVVNLEARYFMAVHRLHAFLALGSHRVNPFSFEGMKLLSAFQEQKSYQEAQRLLSLLTVAPRGDVGLYWEEYQAFLAALVTILAYHLNDPRGQATPPQPRDMRMYQDLISDLGVLEEKSGNVEISKARQLSIGLFSKLDAKLRLIWLRKHQESRQMKT